MSKEQKRFEQNVRLQVVKMVMDKPNIPPENIIKESSLLTEWILGCNQPLPSSIVDKE